jgi:hypothetical protein
MNFRKNSYWGFRAMGEADLWKKTRRWKSRVVLPLSSRFSFVFYRVLFSCFSILHHYLISLSSALPLSLQSLKFSILRTGKPHIRTAVIARSRNPGSTLVSIVQKIAETSVTVPHRTVPYYLQYLLLKGPGSIFELCEFKRICIIRRRMA